MTVKIVKGVVRVEGNGAVPGTLNADDLRLLTSKLKGRSALELWRARLPDLNFLADLPQVDDLSIINCKVADVGALSGATGIRRLFINGVRFAGGLGFLGEMHPLEDLQLLNQRGTVDLPSLAGLTGLVNARVWGCNGFTDVQPLADAPNLRDAALVATGVQLESLTPLLRHPVLESLDVQFGTQREQRAYENLLAEAGKTRFPLQ